MYLHLYFLSCLDDSVTTGGRPGDGAACTIPFTAYGETHYGCTRLQSDGNSLYDYDWCSLTDTFTSGGEWGKCVHPDDGNFYTDFKTI